MHPPSAGNGPGWFINPQPGCQKLWEGIVLLSLNKLMEEFISLVVE